MIDVMKPRTLMSIGLSPVSHFQPEQISLNTKYQVTLEMLAFDKA